MGVEGGASEKKVAFVKCKGTCDKTRVQYNYFGIDDCAKVAVVPVLVKKPAPMDVWVTAPA